MKKRAYRFSFFLGLKPVAFIAPAAAAILADSSRLFPLINPVIKPASKQSQAPLGAIC